MDAHGHIEPGENGATSRQPSPAASAELRQSPRQAPVPFTPIGEPNEQHPRWQFWRKSVERDFSEQYRPPRWWQRMFSLASLAVISLTAGVMVAVAIAAAVAAVAIALQSLVS